MIYQMLHVNMARMHFLITLSSVLGGYCDHKTKRDTKLKLFFSVLHVLLINQALCLSWENKMLLRKNSALLHLLLLFSSFFYPFFCVSLVWRCITYLQWSPEEPQHRVYHLLLHGVNPQDHRFRPSGKAENHKHIYTLTYCLSRLAQCICLSVSSYYSFIKRVILVDRSRACSSCPEKLRAYRVAQPSRYQPPSSLSPR